MSALNITAVAKLIATDTDGTVQPTAEHTGGGTATLDINGRLALGPGWFADNGDMLIGTGECVLGPVDDDGDAAAIWWEADDDTTEVDVRKAILWALHRDATERHLPYDCPTCEAGIDCCDL